MLCEEIIGMRKHTKEIHDEEIMHELLDSCHVGRLGTNGRDGYPMVKPLNFARLDNKLYFHTAREGEKIDDIRRDNRVCFEVDLPIAYVRSDQNPCKASYLFRSVIIRGKAYLIDDQDERAAALNALMKKYQPGGGYGDYLEDKLRITGIVRIDIEEMVGKEDLGKAELRGSAISALATKGPFPITLER
jgi:nitroimidazol reductase NimA-like FMN-containing flavoprotein (pyridoxamine 5'-phosphate oxidase superfamily)